MAAAAAAAISPCHRTLFFSSATRDGTHRRPISDKDDHLPTAAVISSPSNPFVKHCVKLRLSSSYRHSSGSALVVGLAPITEISRFQESSRRADGSSGLIECLLLLDGAEAPSGGSSRIVRVSSAVMKKVSGLKSVDSTEAIAVMRIPPSFCSLGDGVGGCLSWLPCSPRRLLVLDGIQDPGNLGTLLRSAMAFKWDGAFLLPGCCDPFNDKALRAARGASFQLPIVSGSWHHLEALREKFQMKMLAAHPESDIEHSNVTHSLSKNLADILADKPLCFVLGSEGQGLSKQTKGFCELVNIPMAGEFESLNVSVAGGILLFMLQPNDSLHDFS